MKQKRAAGLSPVKLAGREPNGNSRSSCALEVVLCGGRRIEVRPSSVTCAARRCLGTVRAYATWKSSPPSFDYVCRQNEDATVDVARIPGQSSGDCWSVDCAALRTLQLLPIAANPSRRGACTIIMRSRRFYYRINTGQSASLDPWDFFKSINRCS